MSGPDQSVALTALVAPAIFIACGIATGYTLFEYQLEAQRLQPSSTQATAWDLIWLDFTATPE